MEKTRNWGGGPSKERNTNLELFRIITMLLIVAAHYVSNAGMVLEGGPIYSDPTSWRSYFLLSFGAWGKVGINCFVLITGYFMCKSQTSVKKWMKLFLEVEFYQIVIYLIFFVAGYEDFSIMNLVKVMLPVTKLGSNFVGCYLIFYLFIPFLNKLIHNLTEKQHICLVSLSLFAYTVIDTIPKFYVNFNYVSWFAIVYLIGSFIRLYPHNIFQKKLLWGVVTFILIVVSIISVCAMTFVMAHFNVLFNQDNSLYFVADSNKILAIITAVTSIMLFKNIKIRQSKFINTVAASTFGVLLIHISYPLSTWLWNNVIRCSEMFYSSYLILHALVSVLAVYTVCTVIDYLRIRFLEKPFFKFWDAHYDSVNARITVFENSLCEKLHIQNK